MKEKSLQDTRMLNCNFEAFLEQIELKHRRPKMFRRVDLGLPDAFK